MVKTTFDQYDTLEIIQNILNDRKLLNQLTDTSFKITPDGKGQTHIQIDIDFKTSPSEETPEMFLKSGQQIELR